VKKHYSIEIRNKFQEQTKNKNPRLLDSSFFVLLRDI